VLNYLSTRITSVSLPLQEAVRKRDSWKSVGMEPPLTDNLSAEAEEYPFIETVTRERLLKIQQEGKGLSGCCGDLYSLEIRDGSVITWSSELCEYVVNKFIHRSKTPSRVTLTRGDIFCCGQSN
jgi:hypothetical protein